MAKMQRERVIDKATHQVSEYSSIKNFLKADKLQAGISTIRVGGLPIDFLMKPGSSSTTIFFFHGALNADFTLPVLSGLGISGGLDANRVFISDPSLILDDTLTLAWYAGNKKQPRLQWNLTRILKKIIDSFGSDRVVFFGGSGGGFASLFFASKFENSLALVFNPQTNIAKYDEKAVRAFAEKAFHVEPDHKDPLSQLPSAVVSDLSDVYTTSTNTRIAYMQNLSDSTHVESHLQPFLGSLHPKTTVLFLGEHWQTGHSPPPKGVLARVLNLVASSENWVNDLVHFGFKNMSGSRSCWKNMEELRVEK